MRMTASLTSLNAAGMAMMGKELHGAGKKTNNEGEKNLNVSLSLFPHVSVVMTGSYNNFFRMFDRSQRRDITLEASRENSKPMQVLKARKVSAGGKRKKDEISVDSLDFNKKILHTAWHPQDNIIAVATTNNLYIFQDKIN